MCEAELCLRRRMSRIQMMQPSQIGPAPPGEVGRDLSPIGRAAGAATVSAPRRIGCKRVIRIACWSGHPRRRPSLRPLYRRPHVGRVSVDARGRRRISVPGLQAPIQLDRVE